MKPYPNCFNRSTCFGFLGTLLFGSGVALLFLWTLLFDFIIASMMVLKPNSYCLDLWRKPPAPLALDFYFFNWTNPEEIYDLNKKPKFKEMGPYRFTEHREKVNLTWNPNNTITYRQLRYWHFDEMNSVGKLTDQITTLNAVTMSAANQIKNWSYFMKKGFSLSLAAIAPTIDITRSVGQLLFQGYEDPYVDMANTLPFLAETLPPFDKFGWFYTRNESYTFDGIFNMATGEGGNNMGELLEWNYQNQTSYFGGSCNKVHGSAAELYPQRQKRSHIGFFSPDMCRHVQLDYEDDILVKDIKGYKFSAQKGMLDNGTLVPENECYCNGECIPSGLLNISSCRYGTPSFVSLPHFYGADPVYLTMVDGLQPEKDKHEVFITLEPKTGAPLDVAIRLQLNIRLFPVEDITLYENVPDVFFPMLWFEQAMTVPDDLAWQMKLLLSSPIIFPVCAYLFMITGSILIVHLTFKLITGRMFRTENTSCMNKEEVPLRICTDNSYSPKKRKLHLLDLIYS